MKVLITGGCGFIGSHTAERFHKEGHEVYIIDNLASGKRKNVNVKHKFYNLDILDSNCEEIFASNLFDIVVHLAAEVDASASVKLPSKDTNVNVLGLVNILNLSEKYSVKKFIFASSAAVYGNSENLPLNEKETCTPISPYGLNKLVGEKYCDLWKNTHEIDTVSLRFANVYGPRQSLKGEGTVILNFVTRIQNSEELIVFGDGEQTRDFIYVADIADAIYKASSYTSSSVINISSKIGTSVNKLVEILKEVNGEVKTKYKEARTGDILHSMLDNSLAIDQLNWSPMFDINTGLKNTYRWYKENKIDTENIEILKKKGHKSEVSNKIFPYIENFLVFMIVVFLSKHQTDNGYSTFLDYKLMYVIIIGIHYGLKQVSISILLACSLYLWEIKSIGHSFLSLIYNANSLIHFCLYIFVGAIIGYTIDNKEYEVSIAKLEYEELNEKFKFLYDIYDESKQVRQELHEQIVNSEDSFGKIFQTTQKLDTLQPIKVFDTAVSVIADIMKSKEVYIFSVPETKYFLRLMSKSKNSELNIPKSIKTSENPGFIEVIDSKEIFVNYKMDMDLPIMMAPIVVNDVTIAIVCIYAMKFEALSLYKKNLFKIVTKLITSSLGRAYEYDKLIHEEKFIDDTNVMKNKYFDEVIEMKTDIREENATEYVLVSIKDKNWLEKAYHNEVDSSIREFDYMGIDKNFKLHVLLTNTNLEEAEFVINRFKQKGVDAEIISLQKFLESEKVEDVEAISDNKRVVITKSKIDGILNRHRENK